MGVLRRSYFFLQIYRLYYRNMVLFTRIFLNLYNKVGRNGRDSAAVGIVRNVYNSPSYGAVGNTVCRMWESCPLLFHML